MSQTSKELKLFEFPLHGSSLIEASAGTGKTFTIAILYLRLVLPPAQNQAADSVDKHSLSPLQILVVTFTEAAAKELRGRIREFLSQAANCFADSSNQLTHDGILLELRQQYASEQWQLCSQRLRAAEQLMDEAAILTIHAWCLRMLKEYVFNIGGDFSPQLLTDVSQLQQQAVTDYWRSFVVGLSPPRYEFFAAQYCNIDGILSHYQQQQNAAATKLEQSKFTDLDAIFALVQPQLWHLKQADWLVWSDELEQLLDQCIDNDFVNKTKVKVEKYRQYFADLRQWTQQPQQLQLANLTELCDLFTPEKFKKAFVDKVPQHPAIAKLNQLNHALAPLQQLVTNKIEQQLLHWLAQRIKQQKTLRNELGFDDLISHLAQALQPGTQAPLAAAIAQQFPAVLIDEFQDTDQLQYQIFDSIYQIKTNRASSAVVLIGDPKQAIYSFRNADIYTYLTAKLATAGRHFNLATNYRSTQAMVQAVNAVFGLAQQQPRGSFMFKTASLDHIPFLAVKSNGLGKDLLIKQQQVAALEIVYSSLTTDQAQSKDFVVQACANQIAELLNLGRQRSAGFVPRNDDGSWQMDALQPIAPADIAILVNNGYQAQQLRQALAARGINTVYLSERDSVFDSSIAQELYIWLDACLNCNDDRAIRAALATPSIATDWGELDRFASNEIAWEKEILRFHDYLLSWRQQGVLVMLQKFLQQHGVLIRLAQQKNQRAITDLLHLAEILQTQSRSLDTEQALLNYLKQQINSDSRSQDQHLRRLESDADVVQIVTVFKAKGLEYPLVFLPFGASVRKADQADDSAKAANLPSEMPQLAADQARLAEDIRKLYVALTRACYYTWVGVGESKDIAISALGYLLQANNKQSVSASGNWPALLTQNCISTQAIGQTPPLIAYQGQDELAFKPVMRLSKNDIQLKYWQLTSYSAFQQQSNWNPTLELDLSSKVNKPSQPDYQSLQDFPAGAKYGTFLHSLFEKLALLGFAANASELLPEYRQYLTSICQQQQLSQWQPLLEQASSQWLNCRYELLEQPFSLAQLSSYSAEMEFVFALKDSDSLQLDALVQQYCHLETADGEALARNSLKYSKLNGMLKGFIDLVFEYQGQYYVLDYKSNRLEAYDRASLAAEIAKHRYDLQYVLYLFALHLLLKTRLADYDYERHVGGAVYLFLRGVNAPGKGLFSAKPPLEMMLKLEQLLQPH